MGDLIMRNTINDKVKTGFVCALCLTFLLFTGVTAQEVSSSSDSGNGSGSTTATSQDDDANAGDFVIKSSIEFGVRLRALRGNEDKFKSDLNYKAGARLFDSSFYATAEDGSGKAFDSLLINASGWGADPNGFVRVSMEKIGWYKFDTMIRRFKYFNNLLNFAENEHNRNTQHNMGDFDVTILPQNEFVKFRAGASFDKNYGPGSATFDYDRDEFPLEYDFDTSTYDLRFGVDLSYGGVNLSFTEGYRNFKEDTSYFITSPQLGATPSPNSSLNTFQRFMPIDGRTYYHKLTGHKFFKGIADISGRFIYSDTKTNFTLDEALTGIDRSGNPVTLDEFLSSGDSSRPNGNGDIGVTFFVNDRIRISDTFGVNSYRISGGNTLLNTRMRTNPAGVPLPTTITNDLVWRFTNYRRYINTVEADFDVNRYFSFFAGYRYTNRRVQLSGLDDDILDPDPSFEFEEDTNTTNTFIGGIKAKPVWNKWTIRFDIEHGQGDNPFTRLANKDFTQIRVKNQITPREDLSIGVSFETKDNSNPGLSDGTPTATMFAADVKSRNFGANVSYMPDPNFSLNAGYNYTYLNAQTDVVFPFASQGFGQGVSIYDLRNNYGYVDVWFRPHPKISIFGAYRISKDTGDGNSEDLPIYLLMGNYPLTFQSPEVRGTLKLFENADVNIGYQFYDYDEKINIGQNYRAHLPYISVTVYLGRKD
jgi:hypothetical protein